MSPYASDPAASRGRRFATSPSATRDAFQRDRDRIIHSIAFRRLRHKTQVFEARVIARALGLNEDLTESLALAHDIGHPPFGHAGESALKAAMMGAGGFDHNAHTLRTLTRIERPYPDHPGLNLTWELLEGLAKHNGPVRHAPWALAEVDADWPLELGTQPSLEAQVAAIADDIAYDNHDIDDGLRAGLLDRAAVLGQPFVAQSWAIVRERWPDTPTEVLLGELIRTGIGRMVEDVLAESRRRIAAAGIASVDAVRAAPGPLIGFSPAMAEGERALKRFMYAGLYHHPQQVAVAERAREIVGGLAQAYLGDPGLLPAWWLPDLPAEEPARTRHVGDFIAGMTDRFAIARYREFVGPVEMPEGI